MSSRVWLLVGGVAAAVVLAAGVVVGVRVFAASKDSADSACTTPSAPLSTPVAAPDQAPSGGGLTVADKGFSEISGGKVSIGAVVTNTSRQAAYRTRVVLRALRADGTPAVAPEVGLFFVQEIPVVLPGERVALGAVASRDTSRGTPATVARVEVELRSTRWVAVDAANPLLRPIAATASGVQTPIGSDAQGWATFSVTGGCAGLVTRGAAVVFRDAGGAIVGGGLDTTVTAETNGRCTGPEALQRVSTEVPRTAEPGKTQVSVYCDVAGAPPDPAGSAKPVN